MLPFLSEDANFALIGALLSVVFIFVLIIFLASRYRRCASNQILVVYGKVGGGKSANCLHGGGAFVWPLIQDYQYLDLTPLTINIPLKGALSICKISGSMYLALLP
ncbi:MAG: hypothetical protein LBP89_08735 [Helicobacteraceae bacterium]|jgi:flotillin|nr:hypothetical protein [Helicobacteraceae bacterium]